MNLRKLTLGGSAIWLLAATPSLADTGTAPLPDGHAPAGVMVDHMHNAGEFMIGYRYSYGLNQGDTLHGTQPVTDHELLHGACLPVAMMCSMRQTEMKMHMHMLDLMYAPSDWLTLMLMPMWMSMDMRMDMPMMHMDMGMGGMDMGMDHMDMMAGMEHGHSVDGLGDTIFGGLVKVAKGPNYNFHAGLLFSAPTGSVDEKDAEGLLTHYMMQPGSGTWDFHPSLTYTGRADHWSWGAQLSGVIRLQDANDSGYKLGSVVQSTAWASYRLNAWLSTSVRALHTRQGGIEGAYTEAHGQSSAADFPVNYGGSFTDAGLGVNLVMPSGMLQGHRLGIEWLEPLRDNVNGYQQRRDGTLQVSWSKAF
ncbi:MAG: transporter [Pseudomonadales bacterium]|nr:transporter [Pseudomonadales bacterium]